MTKFFISSPQKAAAQICFLFLEALYISFQMHTSWDGSWSLLLGCTRHLGGTHPASPGLSNAVELMTEALLKQISKCNSMVP